VDAKRRKRVQHLHRLCGSDNESEATAARRKLLELLHKHGKTWNDLDTILAMDVPLEHVRRFPIRVGFPNQANSASPLS